ncbi:hypothetical protein WICPIJ_005206 [Wickerhamomyces pijperi]|uniref:Uncharacterized protein n=1 Tax=Wickerhamomyces pijperi TaxID=599730 RepID=A0A9P8Q679_WICPI|nr:hypothetical protein WICPIJ_005206 [Wickerhamomyces pijperi]
MANTKIITLKISPANLKKFPIAVQQSNSKTLSNKPKSIKAEEEVEEGTPSKSNSETPSTPLKPKTSPKNTANTSSTSNISVNSSSDPSQDQSKSNTKTNTIRKWAKKPLILQSFTGFQLHLQCWNGGPKPLEKSSVDSVTTTTTKDIISTQDSDSVEGTPVPTSTLTPAPTSSKKSKTTAGGLKLQIKLNNKKIELNKDNKNTVKTEPIDSPVATTTTGSSFDDDIDQVEGEGEGDASVVSSVANSRAVSPVI